MKILLRSNKTFRGPFTDEHAPEVGEVVTEITPSQYATLNALAAYTIFDGTTFRRPSNAESLLIPYKDAISSGYVIPGSSPEVRLAITDLDRAQFVALLTFLAEADSAASETIFDMDGVPRTFSVTALRAMLVGYGYYYKSLVAKRYGA